MLNLEYTNQYKKDVKLAKKRGKDLTKMQTVVDALLRERALPAKYRDHALSGDFKDHRECHIEPDWLLVYLKKRFDLILVRTGTHSDLFE